MPKNLSLTIEMAIVCFLIFVNLWLLYRLVNKKTAIQTTPKSVTFSKLVSSPSISLISTPSAGNTCFNPDNNLDFHQKCMNVIHGYPKLSIPSLNTIQIASTIMINSASSFTPVLPQMLIFLINIFNYLNSDLIMYISKNEDGTYSFLQNRSNIIMNWGNIPIYKNSECTTGSPDCWLAIDIDSIPSPISVSYSNPYYTDYQKLYNLLPSIVSYYLKKNTDPNQTSFSGDVMFAMAISFLMKNGVFRPSMIPCNNY